MTPAVKTGLDNIHLADSILSGVRVGLMTNPSGIDSGMRTAIDIINSRYNLTALFACEHGVRGCAPAGAHIDTFTDERTGVTVYSCYGANTHLSQEMLDAFDVFVYDIQDAGARFYTFIYSLANAMEDCAKAGKPVVVLDRPAPLDGLTVQGTLLDEKVSSFVGRFAIPTRYGLTSGEFARWTQRHLSLDIELHVIPMTGWTRSMKYADTGLTFVPPSPNCATLHAMDVYTGTCVFEGTNISEGRGTTLPFEYIGAPFIDAEALAKRMNGMCIPGFAFREAYFTPTFSKHTGELCGGVQVYVTDRAIADVPRMGLKLLEAAKELSGDKFEWLGIDERSYYTIDRLLGTDDFRLGKLSADELMDIHAEKIRKWLKDAESIMLY